MLEDGAVYRGALFMFDAHYPFEEKAIVMLCENRGSKSFPFNLVTITGYKSGINPLQNLPAECRHPNGGLDLLWLINNWGRWIYPDCDVSNVYIRAEPLLVDDLQ